MNDKPIYVTFVTKKLEDSFEELKEGKYESKKIYEYIEKAITTLRQNPEAGTKIAKRLWPLIYVKEYSIVNLWKYNLPEGWRLVYTIKEEDIKILSIILEWFNHKDYERRFGY